MTEKTVFKVTSNPVLRAKRGTKEIMRDVLIAMVPALAVGVWMFGLNALLLLLVSVASCVFFEWAYRKLMKKEQTIGDLSAVVTGVLMAMVLPAELPLWMAVIGAFFAIIIVKQLFGGIGKNFVNPALAARAFLFSYPVAMTTWSVPSALSSAVDAETMATPLTYMFGGEALPSYMNLANTFFGTIPGSMGEVSALAIIAGGVFLMWRGVITWRIPASFLGAVALISVIFGGEGYGNVEFMLLNLCTGGVMLGAFFMATDYSSSPVNLKAQLVYGFGCGAITMLIRYFGSYPEGVSYAILVMNSCAWSLDKLMRPLQFGVSTADYKAEKAAAKALKKREKLEKSKKGGLDI